MCDLCSAVEVERKAAQKHELLLGNDLKRLADKLYQLSSGAIKPHSKEAEVIGLLAKRMIYNLVVDWL
jgi:hypothetical protein